MVPIKAEACYRLNAVKCVELSQDPHADIKDKVTLLTMANAWLELAHRAGQHCQGDLAVS
jgi:hypothetical protein